MQFVDDMKIIAKSTSLRKVEVINGLNGAIEVIGEFEHSALSVELFGILIAELVLLVFCELEKVAISLADLDIEKRMCCVGTLAFLTGREVWKNGDLVSLAGKEALQEFPVA